MRQLNGAITSLKQVEDVRNQAADSVALSKRARGGLGALGRWAAGGAVTAKSPEEEREEGERKTIAAVRESIILYLQQKLEEAGRVQSEMMEVRLNRELEKSKSSLEKSRIGGGIPYARDDDLNGSTSPMSPDAPQTSFRKTHEWTAARLFPHGRRATLARTTTALRKRERGSPTPLRRSIGSSPASRTEYTRDFGTAFDIACESPAAERAH